jgi:hypothetical protein
MRNPTFLNTLLAIITGLATLSVLCSITYSPLLIATIPLLMAGYKLKKYIDKIGV